MHPSLALRGRAPELEAEAAVVELLAKHVDGGGTDVLHAVPDALGQVRDVAVDRALVLDGARHTLCNLESGVCTEITVVGSFLHGINGPHATVSLESHSVVSVEVLTWGLLCSCQQTAAHCGTSAKGQGLHDVTRAADATIRQDRDSELASVLRDVVHSRGLCPAASAHFLCSADGPDAHSDSKSICAAIDQVLCLSLGHDVARNYLQLRELCLHPPDHLVLEHAVTLAAVHDDSVNTSLNQGTNAVAISRSGAHSSSDHQVLAAILGGMGVVCILLQVSSGHKRNQALVLGDDRELALLGFLQDSVGVLQVDTLIGANQVAELCHNLADKDISSILHEVGIPASHEAEQCRLHLPVRGDRETGEAALLPQDVELLQSHVRDDADRAEDESGFVLLDFDHFRNLVSNGQIGVDHTDSTLQCEGDGHPGLGDRVHGAGDDGNLEPDVSGEVSVQLHITNAEVNVARHADEIVVGVANLDVLVLEDIRSTVAINKISVVDDGLELLLRGSAAILGTVGLSVHGGHDGNEVTVVWFEV
mmetsp:Transcript_51612/g.109666  ORF Transcript_51612/g.109666 Transcript_51612/m.109666 type:complete len:535 (+) Transcript_51612:195-1799(+)